MKIEFNSERHENPQDSQVFIAITGSPKEIRAKLCDIIADFDQFKKPMQGIYSCEGTISEVITPIWKGEKY